MAVEIDINERRYARDAHRLEVGLVVGGPRRRDQSTRFTLLGAQLLPGIAKGFSEGVWLVQRGHFHC